LQAELHGGRSREAQARIRIDHLLEAAGWHFFDEDGARANVALESGVKLGARVVDFFL
jgi:type I restriction enzyme R subunit